jgi:hypothetical protein
VSKRIRFGSTELPPISEAAPGEPKKRLLVMSSIAQVPIPVHRAIKDFVENTGEALRAAYVVREPVGSYCDMSTVIPGTNWQINSSRSMEVHLHILLEHQDV